MARYNIGDTIKDTNPRCTHYGAIGKVVKIDGGKTTFVVTNKGNKYSKGDKLTKTDWQLEKQAIAVTTAVALGATALWGIGKAVKGISKVIKGPGAKMHAAKAKKLQGMGAASRRLPVGKNPGNWTGKSRIKAAEHAPKVKKLPDGSSMTISTPIDSIMYKILSDTTAVKQRQAVLDSIRTGKLDPKEYNARPKVTTKPKPIEKEGEVNMFKFNGQNKVAEAPKYDQLVDLGAASSKNHMYPEAARLGKVQGVIPGVIGGGVLGTLATSKIKNKKVGLAATILGALGGSIVGANLGERLVGGPRLDKTAELAKDADLNKMREYINDGYDVNEAARLAYPGSDDSAVANYVAEFKGVKKKKRRKMYVDRVVLKSAELIQKAARKVNFDKVANKALGYGGNLPTPGRVSIPTYTTAVDGISRNSGVATSPGKFTGGTKQPGQVGAVSPTGGGGH